MSSCLTIGRVLHFPKPQSPRWTVMITCTFLIHACAVTMAMLTGGEVCILTFGKTPIKIPKIDCKSTGETQKGFAFTCNSLEWYTECIHNSRVSSQGLDKFHNLCLSFCLTVRMWGEGVQPYSPPESTGKDGAKALAPWTSEIWIYFSQMPPGGSPGSVMTAVWLWKLAETL